jgi:hypothetical protein
LKPRGPFDLGKEALAGVVVSSPSPPHVSDLIKIGASKGKIIDKKLRVLG